MATITAILASATFIWVVSIAVIVLMAILLEFEKEGWATTLFSIGTALILWNFRGVIWEYMTGNPSATIGFIVSYVVIGIVWSFIKWRTYVKKIFNKFKSIRLDFIAQHTVIDNSNRKHFNQLVEDAKFVDTTSPYGYTYSPSSDETIEKIVVKITPRASKKKAIITSWISYWPVSLAATLLNNPFRQFFEWIYDNISGIYDKITKRYQNDALGIKS